MTKHEQIITIIKAAPASSKTMLFHLSNAFVDYLTTEGQEGSKDEAFYRDTKSTFQTLSGLILEADTAGDEQPKESPI